MKAWENGIFVVVANSADSAKNIALDALVQGSAYDHYYRTKLSDLSRWKEMGGQEKISITVDEKGESIYPALWVTADEFVKNGRKWMKFPIFLKSGDL